MDYQTWKKNHIVQKLDMNTFEQRKKEYNFSIEKQSTTQTSRSHVKGVCFTSDCNNTYTKTFETFEKSSGPYCYACIGRKKEVRHGFLIKEHPLIAESIIEIMNNTNNLTVDKLTGGMNTEIKWRCSEKCLRCGKYHEYISRVDQRVSGRGCPICCSKKNCECQRTDEFRCFTCKEIKHITQKIKSANYCKLCYSKRHDGNLVSFATMLATIVKQRKSKLGDLTFDNILEKYDKQDKKCFISNIILGIGRFQNWQMSIERVNESGNYDNNNTTLICIEFQSGCRQWNIQLWDDFCSYVKGSLNNIPNEDEYLEDLVSNVRSKKSSRKTGCKAETNVDNGQTKCKTCLQWLDSDKFYKSMLKIGYCTKCEQSRQKQYANTFMGRVIKLYNSSKQNSSIRKGEASRHSITIDDIIQTFVQQKGRCAYSNIPLRFSGKFQMSLERKNVHEGYTKHNICLIILELNVSDRTMRKKNKDDDRNGFSAWNREKVLWAVSQNPRDITPKILFVRDINSELQNNKNQVQ